ncbi:hypothetical protein ACFQ07_05550, partial [Actinomadura adrarensis]
APAPTVPAVTAAAAVESERNVLLLAVAGDAVAGRVSDAREACGLSAAGDSLTVTLLIMRGIRALSRVRGASDTRFGVSSFGESGRPSPISAGTDCASSDRLSRG